MAHGAKYVRMDRVEARQTGLNQGAENVGINESGPGRTQVLPGHPGMFVFCPPENLDLHERSVATVSAVAEAFCVSAVGQTAHIDMLYSSWSS